MAWTTEATPLESEVERKGTDYARRRGWYEFKIASSNKRGIPDRFYARNGRVMLVEWKRPGGGARKLQEVRIRELREHGVEVHVIATLEQAYELFR